LGAGRTLTTGSILKEQCHHLRITNLKTSAWSFQVYDSRWRPFGSEHIAIDANISAHRCKYKADETLKILE
jgi:hypothetical protein